MPANRVVFRFVSNAIHSLLIFGSLVLLGSGWIMQDPGLSQPDRRFWMESHTSLGLSCAILVLLQALLWTIRRPGADLDRLSPRRGRAAGTITILLYLSLVVVIASGYVTSVASGRPLSYWGLPLPQWDATSIVSALRLGEIHRLGAFVAGGLIFLHVALSSLNLLRRRRNEQVEPAPPTKVEQPREPGARQLAASEKQNLVLSKAARSLAQNLQIFGWIDFWVQFVLALIVGLLLAFAASGVAFSPSRPGFGSSIYWGLTGFLLLLPSVVLAFAYVRASRHVVASPTDYLHHERRLAFWFLWIGLVISGIGVFVSFAGVAMSIALLIVKTISQPPGLAITDPNNIIRALDVFVLIVNFMLLIAHFVGVVTALWLGFCASKARVGYISSGGHPIRVSG